MTLPRAQAGGADAVERATGHLMSLQQPGGAWEGEMVWNTMILSQYVILHAIVDGTRGIDERSRRGIIRHYTVTQRGDGSWGMHPESEGYVFFTALGYVALRLLGLPAEHPLTSAARRWLADHGGVLAIPTWGKLWLCFVGLYGWEGVNPCPPELFLLPEAVPLHPRNYYCHTRNIYLAISYLFGSRFTAELPLTAELRRELYDEPFESIDFSRSRHALAASDLYVAPTRGLRFAWDVMARYERHAVKGLRRRALEHCFARIVYEQENSAYQGLSPVNGILNCIALYAEGRAAGREHPALQPSVAGVEAWRWDDEAEGIRYTGARSHTWDTAFVLQSQAASPSRVPGHREALRAGYRFLVGVQTKVEHPDFAAYYRDAAVGGWCFSDGVHGWPVSDCSAEAICALLAVHREGDRIVAPAERIPDERLAQGADFILARQNRDGGFGSYERRRAGGMLETLNPTEMFGACMTERSYIECSASSLAALAHLSAEAGGALGKERVRRVDRAVGRALRFLRKSQRPDGTWPAFWGIYYTWSIFHAVKAMRAAGVPKDDPALLLAARWLREHQKADGGWGEHYTACLDDRYVEHPRSQVMMTGVALLSLQACGGPSDEAIARGADFLRARQQADGSWPSEALNGVFFGSAMLDYRLYKSYFPTWALLGSPP